VRHITAHMSKCF